MTEQEKKMWQDDIAFIEMLNKRNKDLQDRIDKAIEYIEQNKYVIREYISANSGTKKVYELCCEPDELLKILEGNNENIK